MTEQTLIVQPTFPEYRRGFLEAVSNKIAIHLICSESSPDGAEGVATNMTFGSDTVECIALPGYLFWQKGVVSALWRRRPTVLVIGGNPRYLSSVVALFVAKLRGVRIVLWGHARSSTSGAVGTWLRTRLMYLADQILVYYTDEIPLLPERLRVRAAGVGNSVDTDGIVAVGNGISESELHVFGQKNGFAGRPLLVTLGRLTSKARVDRVIRAIAKVNQGGNDAILAIIGDGPVRKELEELVAELQIEDSVLWTGEISDDAALSLWMRSACIFVYGGAVGLSLIHAFAYGLPAVISSRVEDHNPEALLFVEGAHGAMFDARDSDSLAAVLSEQLEDPAKLVAMGDSAQAMVVDQLGIDRMANRFVAAIAKARSGSR